MRGFRRCATIGSDLNRADDGATPKAPRQFCVFLLVMYFRKNERKVNYHPSNIYYVSQKALKTTQENFHIYKKISPRADECHWCDSLAIQRGGRDFQPGVGPVSAEPAPGRPSVTGAVIR